MAMYAVFKAPEDSAAVAASYNKPVVLEFSSPLCAECQKLKKVLEVVEPKYKNKIVFKKINAAAMTRETQKLVEKYDIQVVPTTIYINKDGEITGKTEGALHQENLEQYLNELCK